MPGPSPLDIMIISVLGILVHVFGWLVCWLVWGVVLVGLCPGPPRVCGLACR